MALTSALTREVQSEPIPVAEGAIGVMTPFRQFLDKYFYLSMALLCVAIKLFAIVQGSGHAVSYIENDSPIHPAASRPLALWLHNIAFSAWLGFFILQSALVRVHQVKWHRWLDWFGIGLGTVMVPLGIATAIVKGRQEVALSWGADAQANLLGEFFNTLAFGVLFALAVWSRRKPEFYWRLLFIATCGMLYGIFFNFDIVENHFLFYTCVDLVIGLGILRDLFVDRRVHKVYLIAVPALVASQAVVSYMWMEHPAWWMRFAHSIIG